MPFNVLPIHCRRKCLVKREHSVMVFTLHFGLFIPLSLLLPRFARKITLRNPLFKSYFNGCHARSVSRILHINVARCTFEGKPLSKPLSCLARHDPQQPQTIRSSPSELAAVRRAITKSLTARRYCWSMYFHCIHRVVALVSNMHD